MVNKDWERINKAILDQYNKTNTEYTPLLKKPKTKTRKTKTKTTQTTTN
jgi:hypothetical protein